MLTREEWRNETRSLMESFAHGHTDPDDNWLPASLLFVMEEGSGVCGVAAPTEDLTDSIGKVLQAVMWADLARSRDGQRVAIVHEAWCTWMDSTMPPDDAPRDEAVILTHLDADGTWVDLAYVGRSETALPLLTWYAGEPPELVWTGLHASAVCMAMDWPHEPAPGGYDTVFAIPYDEEKPDA